MLVLLTDASEDWFHLQQFANYSVVSILSVVCVAAEVDAAIAVLHFFFLQLQVGI